MYAYQRDQVPSPQVMQGLCDSSFYLEGHLLELYGQVKNLSGREREKAGGEDGKSFSFRKVVDSISDTTAVIGLAVVRREMATLFNMLEPYRAGIAKVRYGEDEEVEDAREMSVSIASHCFYRH